MTTKDAPKFCFLVWNHLLLVFSWYLRMLERSWERWAVTSRSYANTTPVLRKGSNALFGKIFNYSVNSLDSAAMKRTCTLYTYIGPALMKEWPTPPAESALTMEANRESSVSRVINDGLNDLHMVSSNARCALSITSWPHLVPTQSPSPWALEEKLPRVIEIDFQLAPRLFIFLKSHLHAPCMPSRWKYKEDKHS